MNSHWKLMNPDGRLLVAVEQKLRLARKAKPIWAKRLYADQSIETLEGSIRAVAGNYLCRGVVGEVWAQAEPKLREKYSEIDEFDADDWQRFDPKPDAPLVAATVVDEPFQVESRFGKLRGKAGDYIVRSITDPSDVWIVAKAIFEASYEMVKSRQPQLDEKIQRKVVDEKNSVKKENDLP